MNIKKDESGFGFILILLFLGLFSTLLFSAGFVRFSFEARSDFRYFCYNDLRNVQKILLESERALLALNPAAHALRIRLRLLYVQLAAATATFNFPLIAQTTQWIMQIQQQQRALRVQQQNIITLGQATARAELAAAYARLIAKNRARSVAWSDVLQIQDGLRLNSFFPNMAVSPDSRIDIAPAYVLNPDFENEQRISAFWTLGFFAKDGFEIEDHERSTPFWSLRCDSQPQSRQELSPIVKADKL